MRTWGIVVAAGAGARLGASEPKAFVPLAGIPMVGHALRAFRGSRRIEGVVVVTPPGFEERIPALAEQVAPGLRVFAVAGGTTRSASVRTGLHVADIAGETPDAIVVHDAARPLATASDIDASIRAVEGGADAAVCGAPAGDTLKRVSGGTVTTVPREDLYHAFTPQAFRAEALRAAHSSEPEATDDAALVEAAGGRVVIVPAHAPSLKVTTQEDLATASRLLGPARTGIGTDVHAFAPAAEARPLILGGVEIPGARGLAGHSDADVLTHAVVDAVLGAAALGDIGTHFPSSDPRWAGAPSLDFARTAAALAREAGWEIGSVDATVVLEEPPIGRYRDAMRAALGTALGAPVEAVGVKATTTDHLGFIGRGEGAAALAVATLLPRERVNGRMPAPVGR